METKDYEKAVLNTESTATSINFGTLSTHAVLGLIAKTACIVDQVKKATFYAGREVDLAKFQQDCEELINCTTALSEWAGTGTLSEPRDVHSYGEGHLPPELAALNLKDLNIRLLHATYGVHTEAGEMAEALAAAWEAGEQPDRVNMSEEVGDVMWYLAVAADELKVPFSVLFQQNITKLNDKKNGRYRKGGFNVDEAINRDLKSERANLAMSIGEEPIRHAGNVGAEQAERIAQNIEAENGAWGLDQGTGHVYLNEAAIKDNTVQRASLGDKVKDLGVQALDKVGDGVDAAKNFLKK